MANRWLEELGGLLERLRSEMAGAICSANAAGGKELWMWDNLVGKAGDRKDEVDWRGEVMYLGDRGQCGKRRDAVRVGKGGRKVQVCASDHGRK